MIVEDFPLFSEWIMPGLLLFGGIALAAALLGIFFGFITASFRHGPFEAFYIVAQVIAEAIPDFLYTSPRRVVAMARLAIKEALRRRVILVTFGIFAATLLFGGWFMDAGSESPHEIYLNFVLWGTQLLILLTGLLISAFSLPEDIKNKTIYTIVTKPVRATEIVLGRILGFGALCSALLALMAVISFFFIWRNLSHDHLVAGDNQTIAAFTEVDPDNRISRITGKRVSDAAVLVAQTNNVSGHTHRLEVVKLIVGEDKSVLDLPDVWKTETEGDNTVLYRVVCFPVGGHTHRITVSGSGNDAIVTIGQAIGQFRARVPLYAKNLTMLDKEGQVTEKGISVGREWNYRGYIDGGSASMGVATLAKAIFDFEDLRASKFDKDSDVVPLDLTLGVFRTFKGDVQKRVTGGIQFESVPDNAEVENRFISDINSFETNEFQVQTRAIPRKMIGRMVAPDGSLVREGEFDLFDDIAKNGKLRLNLTCRDINQYIGVATADVYFRQADNVYWINFFKAYVGIWCQLMIIICMGVALSTFLSTPLVMLGTLVMMVVGFFTPFIRELTIPDRDGGGPIESLIRVITQKNMQVDLETGVLDTVIEKSDQFITQRMSDLTYLAPNFSNLDFSQFLTHGYAIDTQRMLVAIGITLAFFVGLTLLGYFSLKTREIAK